MDPYPTAALLVWLGHLIVAGLRFGEAYGPVVAGGAMLCPRVCGTERWTRTPPRRCSSWLVARWSPRAAPWLRAEQTRPSVRQNDAVTEDDDLDEAEIAERTPKLRRTVLTVAGLNFGYFWVEIAVALAIGSVSLFADSVDFLEDTFVNLLIYVSCCSFSISYCMFRYFCLLSCSSLNTSDLNL